MEEFSKSFPTNGILPKKETTALTFLSKYPNYDGRGVIIAILDTGVDPGALGLQVTSDSKPKILDLIDATGSGNCDISTEVKVDAEGSITGVSGRKLKIPSRWSNPSGKYKVGMKAMFDLCSVDLRERLRQERKSKLWQQKNSSALAKIQKKLSDMSALTKSSSTSQLDSVSSTTNDDEKENNKNNDKTEFINTLVKEDLQAQLDLVNDLEAKVKDCGPVYDCIVWHDGDVWRACVDTTEKGDLESCKVLTNYRDSHEYGTFSALDMLNYSVRILHDENVLQIVTDSSAHGTHVASIAAGFYEDKPELNGIAPGAQIVSIKIGDNRINGMETGFALVNACRHIVENKCDLVNYSFGEPTSYANAGPALVAVQELVEKWGVIFCASAGNDGPGIETVGAPGGFGTATISVAAYLSNDMIKAEHSLLGNGNAQLFTWSSRGPCMDGHAGVSITAPGGAFASVPNWCQRGTQLMSGTSMSSPNCCGSLALILSGLKQKFIEFNPFGVKRAIENTALHVDESIGTGAGLIQVEKAFEYLVEYKDNLVQKIQFECQYQTSKPTRQMRGIYLKHSDELNETRDYLIKIEPKFFENRSKTEMALRADSTNEYLLDVQKEKISFNKKLVLVCENNDNASQWVECPDHLYMFNNARQFFVKIKANQLQEGHHYHTQIKAFDLDDPKMGPLFKIPINVVKPITFDGSSNKKLKNDYEVEFKDVNFKHGKIYRHFLRAPFGATHAELTLKCEKENRDHTPLFFIQSFTLENFRSPTEAAKEEVYRLNTTNEFKFLFKVNPNKITQLSIAKNWSNIGNITADYSIKLRGLYPRNLNEMSIFSNQPYKIDVGSFLRNEDCEPSVSWKYHIQPIRPSEHQIELVKDTLGQMKPVYQIVLTYNFHQTKANEVCCEVPLLSNHLYENEYQSMFWMLFEANTKRYLLSGDAFPLQYKYAKTLEKGDYVVKLHIRHDKKEMLEKLKEVTLNVRHSISGQLNQDIYTSYSALLKANGKSSSERICKNTEATYYMGPIPEDKLPKGIANGNYLQGQLTFFKDPAISKIDNHRIFYYINSLSNSSNKKQTDKSKSTSKSSSDSAADGVSSTSQKKTDDDKLNEAVRDAKVAYILKSNDIFESLRNEYPDHIPIYLNRIQYLDQKLSGIKNDNEKKTSMCDEIISLSKAAIQKIDQNELLKYLGEKFHEPGNEENKKDFENQKNWIIELLIQQGIAIIEKNSTSNISESSNADLTPESLVESLNKSSVFEEIKSIYRQIQKWIDINDDKVTKFLLKSYTFFNLRGKALKILFKQLEDKPGVQQTDQAILNIFKQLNLPHANEFYENHMILKYVKQYAIY